MCAPVRKVLFTLLLPLLTSAAHAAEWKIEPLVRFEAGYNDNIRMNIDDEISSAEFTFSPGSKFSVETPQSGLSGNLRFDFRRFEEDSNLDDNNVRFDISSFRNMEKSKIGLDLDFIKDTTLDSQLEETGLAFGRVKRYQVKGGPNWSYRLDERSEVSFSYNYTDTQYKNAGGTGFVDYTVNSGNISLARIMSERITASITLAHSRSDNENRVESKNTDLRVGASYDFSDTLSASLSAGGRYTETDYSQNTSIPIFVDGILIGFVPLSEDVSKDGSGYTFDGSISKIFLRGETSFSASRDISYDLNGIPIEVIRLKWKNMYRFTETLSANLDLGFYNSESNDSVSRRLNRDYYTINPKFNWDFKKFWRISGRYQYRKQTFDDTNDDATQNAAYLTLTYRWPRIAASR